MRQILIAETDTPSYLLVAAFGALAVVFGAAAVGLLLRPRDSRWLALVPALLALVCCLPAGALYHEFAAVAAGRDLIRFEYPFPRPAQDVSRGDVCGLALVRHGSQYRLSGWRTSWTLEVSLCSGGVLRSAHAWRPGPPRDAALEVAAVAGREVAFLAHAGGVLGTDTPLTEAEWASPAPRRY